MNTSQRGFTLVELVVVIVILGILAAVAIPKFVDMSSEAEGAALDGIAGAAGSASAINYAGCSALKNVVTSNKCVKISTCAGVSSLLLYALPTGVTLDIPTGGADPGTTNGTTGICAASKTVGGSLLRRTFVAISAGN